MQESKRIDLEQGSNKLHFSHARNVISFVKQIIKITSQFFAYLPMWPRETHWKCFVNIATRRPFQDGAESSGGGGDKTILQTVRVGELK